MLAELLPATVSTAELFRDAPHAMLFPEEAKCISRAVAGRQVEFRTGRFCARLALRRLGVIPSPIPQGHRGAPRWPRGAVGSITHCSGYRAAAVARRLDLHTLGIDAEPNERLPRGVFEVIAQPGERASVTTLTERYPDTAWDRLLFSAKEAIYKAWAPLTGLFLDFDGASVAFDPATARFVGRILLPAPDRPCAAPARLLGQYAVRDGFIVTAVAC